MFKIGDTVRVLRLRNVFGHIVVPDDKFAGRVVRLTGHYQGLADVDFRRFTTDSGFIVREDDIELVNDSPVREVTRREIVPGTYGRVIVDSVLSKKIVVAIDDWHQPMTAEELDNVAMIASQLAEALRDG